MKRIAFILTAFMTAASIFISFNTNAQTAKPSTPVPAASPTPKPTEEEIIKIDTELVNLDVRVVDRNNRPINTLVEKDFKIYEDGSIQQIDFFSKSEVPTNYGLVVDNSNSLRSQIEKVIEAGKVFVANNRRDDETMIVRFVGRDKIEIKQEFTSNREDLDYALDNLNTEGGQTAIRDAVYLTVENIDEYEQGKAFEDKKRRAMILITDGEDRNSYYAEKQLYELLRESEVQIYVIGFIDDLSKEGGFISKSPQTKAKEFLEKLASMTGGKAYFPKSAAELPTLAREISSELRTQYSIGYIPSNDRKDGTYRAIKVSVADGPNAQKRIAATRAGRKADGGMRAATPSPTPK